MIVDLNLKDRNVLVIGAGKEGTKRIEALSKQGCQIIVLSDTINDALYEVEGSGRYPIIINKRKIKDIDWFDEFDNIFFTIKGISIFIHHIVQSKFLVLLKYRIKQDTLYFEACFGPR